MKGAGRPRAVGMLLQNPYDTDIRVRRKAEALVAAGYAVDVFALRGSASRSRYTLNGVQVFTVALGKKRGSIVRYAFEYAAFLAWASLQLLARMWRRRYTVVEANTLPDFLVFAAAPARWMGARLVLDMHEITPEFYMSKYGIGASSRLVRALTAVERWSFDFADHVITVNEPIRELLASRGLPPWKCSVVMNAVDEALFRPGAVVSPTDVPAPDGFVMMYHGTLTSVYGLSLAIEALALARSEVPGAELWILGAGPERQALERLAQARGLDDAVRFLPQVPPGEVAAWVSRCDAGVLPMRRDVFLEYAFPNKLSEYIVLDKPVMIARLRTMQHYFSDDALAYFEPGDAASLARQMVRLARDPSLRARQADRARAEYAPISWSVMKTRYVQTIDHIASAGRITATSGPAATVAELTAIRGQARTAALHLLAYCRARDWAGHDPYDALNSRLLTALPMLNTRAMRVLLIQGLKRSPLDVRGILGVPRLQNAKGLALILAALFKLTRAGVTGADALVEPVIERLIAMRSPGSRSWCWGYSFPWQTRTVLVPRDAPNLVCTAFVGGALLDAAERGDTRCLRMAVSAAQWMVTELYWRTADRVGFAYPLPSSRGSIHNANLLAAAFLVRVARLTREPGLREPALEVARATVAQQRPDGSWPYGEEPRQRWIDNFHTGYNLCALGAIGRDAATMEFVEPTRRGLAFYRARFFRPDGAPRYFHDRTYPVDVHCVAQSLITLFDPELFTPGHAALGAAVFRWTMRHLWDPRGFFYYQARRFWTSRTSYMRWSQAWMLLALATLIEAAPVKEPTSGEPVTMAAGR
jgi:glycosyltransferase involved in cell wall biosynthesis